jgi:cell division protein FtsI (penicillin-binding protein 3)
MESLAANPRIILEPDVVAKRLAATIGIPAASLKGKLRKQRSFVYLKHYLSPREADAVRGLGLQGVHFVDENRRYYPNVELAGHVLGFVGREHRGLEGLELSQDLLLHGRSDIHPRAKDARGQTIYTHGLPTNAEPKGYSLKLAMDKRIQHIAERELQSTVETYQAKSGMAVVMNPTNGEILAMALQPGFNPNAFSSYSFSGWRNRIVTDAFEPGSTFKIFLAAAALEEGLVDPGDLFYCEQGKYHIAKHTIHDMRKFGWLSLAQILRFSSNIGAAKVGDKLGANRFYHYIRAFGFGTPTGIELPGETAGLVRPPEEWSTIDLAAASFGQSLSVSAIQLALALGAVANGGLLMQPLLVKEVLDSQNQIVRQNQPRAIRRVISKSTARVMKRLLAQVVSPKATGAQAALTHYRAAGKTGTAQKTDGHSGGYVDDRYIASFIGFVPVANPEVVVVVVINEPQEGLYGGVVAAPAFRRIAEQALLCLQVPPEQKGNWPGKLAESGPYEPLVQQPLKTLQPVLYGDEKSGSQQALMPDLTGLSLRAALDHLPACSEPADIHGSGRVVRQHPEPGSALGAASSCSLTLEPD